MDPKTLYLLASGASCALH